MSGCYGVEALLLLRNYPLTCESYLDIPLERSWISGTEHNQWRGDRKVLHPGRAISE